MNIFCLDLNTSRDWRNEPEEGITEEELNAPLEVDMDHNQNDKETHGENHDDEHLNEKKKHGHHKHGHHKHKEHPHSGSAVSRVLSCQSNRVSPGGRESATPHHPHPPAPAGGADLPMKSDYTIPPTDQWVKRWEDRKNKLKVPFVMTITKQNFK